MPEIPLQPIPELIPKNNSYPHIADQMRRVGFQIVKRGMQSENYVSNSAGWKIDAEGNAEFNDGTFRGTFNLGNTQITVDTVAEIQTAIDTVSAAGGGIVFLQPGTYVLTANITIPSNVYLRGVAGVILDLNGSYDIRGIGTNVYNTGTVSITNTGTTVTGVGTTFTSAMVGRYILLQDFWYEITAFTDTTHITIDTDRPYIGTTLSGSTYYIASILSNLGISDVTVKNGTTNAITFSYASDVDIRNITCLDITNTNKAGILLAEASRFIVDNIITDNCDYGVGLIFARYGEVSNIRSSRSRVGSVECHGECRNVDLNTISVETTTTGSGIQLKDCSLFTVDSFAINNTDDNGVRLISGCSNIVISNGSIDTTTTATTSGIALSATCLNIQIIGCQITNCTGYGINIVDSTNTDCILMGNYLLNNSLGGINDVGTRTVIRGNSGGTNGVIDNPQTSRVTSQFNKTSDVTAAAITGLSAKLVAGRAYAFEVQLFFDSAATGGVKAGFSGTATATSFIASVDVKDDATNVSVLINRLTSFSTTTGVTATTGGLIIMRGTIVCNAAGTFIPYFAQNASDVTASSVLVNSTMTVWESN